MTPAMDKPRRVAVIGGGISGLSAAYFLQQESRRRRVETSVSLLERAGQLGGVIRSEKVNGLLLEWGPENFVAYKPQTSQLIRELGLSDGVIGSNDDLHRVFILRDSKLQPLPRNMGFIVPIRLKSLWDTSNMSLSGKLRVLLEPFISRSSEDLSLHAFLTRRVGREMTEKVAAPLLGAIHGGDIRKLSTISTMPDIHRIEQKYGSLWWGMRAFSGKRSSSPGSLFLTMKGGMSELVRGLEQELRDVSIHQNVDGLRLHADPGGYRLRGHQFDQAYDSVIVATPAPAAASILDPINTQAAETLRRIQYSSTTIVYLAYQKDQFSHSLEGFGFVVPREEPSSLRACTWVSSKFEGRCSLDTVLLRCTLPGGNSAGSSASRDGDAVTQAHHELQRLLGITCQPKFSKVSHIATALPQPSIGHAQLVEKVDRLLSQQAGLFLCGSFLAGSGIPQCIATAHAVSERAGTYLESLQKT